MDSSDHPDVGGKLSFCPSVDLEIIFILAESHLKNSENLSPLNFKGGKLDGIKSLSFLRSAP